MIWFIIIIIVAPSVFVFFVRNWCYYQYSYYAYQAYIIYHLVFVFFFNYRDSCVYSLSGLVINIIRRLYPADITSICISSFALPTASYLYTSSLSTKFPDYFSVIEFGIYLQIKNARDDAYTYFVVPIHLCIPTIPTAV